MNKPIAILTAILLLSACSNTKAEKAGPETPPRLNPAPKAESQGPAEASSGPCDICTRQSSARLHYAADSKLCPSCSSSTIQSLEEATRAAKIALQELDALGLRIPGPSPIIGWVDQPEARSVLSPEEAASPRLWGVTALNFDEDNKPGQAEIYVRRFLPREAMIGVFAHELFHLWQTEHCQESLSPELREGTANLIQALVLERREATPWLEILEKDPHPIYGEGYRRARRWLNNRPLETWLEELSQANDWPSR